MQKVVLLTTANYSTTACFRWLYCGPVYLLSVRNLRQMRQNISYQSIRAGLNISVAPLCRLWRPGMFFNAGRNIILNYTDRKNLLQWLCPRSNHHSARYLCPHNLSLIFEQRHITLLVVASPKQRPTAYSCPHNHL